MKRRKGRAVNGVLLLDKPSGITSNDILQKIKRLYRADKAGHTGALDPLATGMLPICLGEATKFSQFLLDADKRYRVIARLGQRTDTSDADGQILCERDYRHLTKGDVEYVLNALRGKIEQVPTMYSALKHQGRPLYEYARQGITIDREPRTITIFENRLERFAADELELEIHCSKGTYIRTIIDDLGELLGCGAHVIYLRRITVHAYPQERMVSYTTLQSYSTQLTELDSYLLPIDSGIQHLPICELTAQQKEEIFYGRAIYQYSSISKYCGIVRLYAGNTPQFIGIGWCDQQGIITPKRLLALLPESDGER